MRIFCFIIALSIPLSCSKGRKPGSFTAVIDRLSKIGSVEEAAEYYTPGTIDAVNRMVKKGLVTPADRLTLLPLSGGKTRVTVMDEKISGNSASVTVRYAEHPVENMVGYDMDLRFVLHDGKWKIDFEREIKGAEAGSDRNRAQDYLKGKASQYKGTSND